MPGTITFLPTKSAGVFNSESARMRSPVLTSLFVNMPAPDTKTTSSPASLAIATWMPVETPTCSDPPTTAGRRLGACVATLTSTSRPFFWNKPSSRASSGAKKSMAPRVANLTCSAARAGSIDAPSAAALSDII